ncbi:MAG TPA: adenylate/guanylate cyclase domain-containing protein [Chthonomonadaceae bacterium]|nr:adenylate/guanylate cyclase domain-containing protein [Chthonomonadaceae bacterium]
MSGPTFSRGLIAKLLAIPLIVVCLGILIPGVVGYKLLERQAERETHEKALMLLYTLAAAQRNAESGATGTAGSNTGGFSAREIMRDYNASQNELPYHFHQVMFHPTGTADRADAYESRLIGAFSADKTLNQVEDEITTKDGSFRVIAIPLRASSAEKGPAIGASVIYIPAGFARAQTNEIFWTVFRLIALLTVFGAALLVWRTQIVVTRPARQMFETCMAIQCGEWGARFVVGWPDELSTLAVAFQRTTLWLRERIATEEKLRAMFQQFIPASVAARALGKDSDQILAGTRHSVTVMIINIRNFKLLMEHLPPDQTVSTLNEFFSEVNRVIVTHKGVVSKYLGDTVLAFFGMPLGNDDHPLNAVRAALAIPPALQRLYVRLDEAYGWELGVGIGITTGEPIVGHFGSSEHMEYTVLGDVVGEAHKLEAITKSVPEEDTVVISETTYRHIMSEVHVLDLGERGEESAEQIHAYVVQGFRSEARKVLTA